MPPSTFRHSTGVLLTDLQTSSPDEHSFVLGDGVICARLGWGLSGDIPTGRVRNPPEGAVHTVHYSPPPGVPFTPADMDALAALLSQHRARYKECRLWVTSGIRNEADIIRWVSGGCIPGTDGAGWETATDPDDELSPEERAAQEEQP